MKKNYYFTTPLIKMGRWNVSAVDSENWHGEPSSRYFKKIFGITKGTMIIQDLVGNYQHAYFPKFYFKKLFNRIAQINRYNYKKLSRILIKFYFFKKQARKAISGAAVRGFKKFSNKQLIKLYKINRDWAHRASAYDQLGWIAEDYWKPIMEKILVKYYQIKKNSAEYYRILFALSKPERISTTLEEKSGVIKAAIEVKAKPAGIAKASADLAKKYGWLPVAAYGTPWEEEHYRTELVGLLKRPVEELENEYERLKNYTKIRNTELRQIVRQYRISDRHLQVFIDFGLVSDARNEAEYMISFAGFYLMPMYKEIARRLFLSISQVRNLYEDEIVKSLQGKIDPLECLRKKGKIIGWGFNKAMTKRIYFTTKEATALFKKIEKNIHLIQGSSKQSAICASPGTVRGKVKIVRTPAENHKVKSGDIMVAHTTMVDYLPAMKKAAAIVTEVGGLTCHAAVVGREFNIPCIVGYKDATKLFHDNQLVEVLADNGLVKKL